MVAARRWGSCSWSPGRRWRSPFGACSSWAGSVGREDRVLAAEGVEGTASDHSRAASPMRGWGSGCVVVAIRPRDSMRTR